MSKANKKTKVKKLIEAQPVERPISMADYAPEDDAPISLDQAIDRYFIQYERESIPTSEMFEDKNVKGLLSYLFEQDLDLGGDAPEEDVPEEDPADDAGVDLGDPFGSDEEADEADSDAVEPQPVVNVPKINMQDFTRSVARLVNNVEALIDIKSIILNRAKAYIKSNYGERTAVEMMNLLDKQWNLKPVGTEVSSVETTKFPEPTTGVTGPVGG